MSGRVLVYLFVLCLFFPRRITSKNTPIHIQCNGSLHSSYEPTETQETGQQNKTKSIRLRNTMRTAKTAGAAMSDERKPAYGLRTENRISLNGRWNDRAESHCSTLQSRSIYSLDNDEINRFAMHQCCRRRRRRHHRKTTTRQPASAFSRLFGYKKQSKNMEDEKTNPWRIRTPTII